MSIDSTDEVPPVEANSAPATPETTPHSPSRPPTVSADPPFVPVAVPPIAAQTAHSHQSASAPDTVDDASVADDMSIDSTDEGPLVEDNSLSATAETTPSSPLNTDAVQSAPNRLSAASSTGPNTASAAPATVDDATVDGVADDMSIDSTDEVPPVEANSVSATAETTPSSPINTGFLPFGPQLEFDGNGVTEFDGQATELPKSIQLYDYNNSFIPVDCRGCQLCITTSPPIGAEFAGHVEFRDDGGFAGTATRKHTYMRKSDTLSNLVNSNEGHTPQATKDLRYRINRTSVSEAANRTPKMNRDAKVLQGGFLFTKLVLRARHFGVPDEGALQVCAYHLTHGEEQVLLTSGKKAFTLPPICVSTSKESGGLVLSGVQHNSHDLLTHVLIERDNGGVLYIRQSPASSVDHSVFAVQLPGGALVQLPRAVNPQVCEQPQLFEINRSGRNNQWQLSPPPRESHQGRDRHQRQLSPPPRESHQGRDRHQRQLSPPPREDCDPHGGNGSRKMDGEEPSVKEKLPRDEWAALSRMEQARLMTTPADFDNQKDGFHQYFFEGFATEALKNRSGEQLQEVSYKMYTVHDTVPPPKDGEPDRRTVSEKYIYTCMDAMYEKNPFGTHWAVFVVTADGNCTYHCLAAVMTIMSPNEDVDCQFYNHCRQLICDERMNPSDACVRVFNYSQLTGGKKEEYFASVELDTLEGEENEVHVEMLKEELARTAAEQRLVGEWNDQAQLQCAADYLGRDIFVAVPQYTNIYKYQLKGVFIQTPPFQPSGGISKANGAIYLFFDDNHYSAGCQIKIGAPRIDPLTGKLIHQNRSPFKTMYYRPIAAKLLMLYKLSLTKGNEGLLHYFMEEYRVTRPGGIIDINDGLEMKKQLQEMLEEFERIRRRVNTVNAYRSGSMWGSETDCTLNTGCGNLAKSITMDSLQMFRLPSMIFIWVA
eukprot:gene22318-28436_t